MKARGVFKKQNFRFLLFIVILIFLYSLETTAFQYIKIFRAKPELTLAAVLSIAMYERPVPAMLIGFFGGILLDLSRLQGEGFSMIMLALFGFFSSILFEFLLRKTLVNVLLVFALADVLHSFLSNVVYILIWEKTFHFSGYFVSLLSEIIYGCMMAIPIYFIIKIIENFFSEAPEA